jgi:hypothetical protein
MDVDSIVVYHACPPEQAALVLAGHGRAGQGRRMIQAIVLFNRLKIPRNNNQSTMWMRLLATSIGFREPPLVPAELWMSKDDDDVDGGTRRISSQIANRFIKRHN